MNELIQRCAAFGWIVRPDGDGWELLGNGAPAVFSTTASLADWLAHQERARSRVKREPGGRCSEACHAATGGRVMLRALDLFCCAGGATRGLQMAGYHVTGVDIKPQPHYCGDVFCQGDAFDWLARDLSDFDLIWGSPKCQGHSVLTPARYKDNHEIQLPRVLDMLRAQPVPYIVENVGGTQVLMRNPVMLCGSMFGLEIWRHRWFELGNTDAFFLRPPCNHDGHPILISGRGMRGVAKGGTRPSEPLKAEKMRGIGIDWMVTTELDQAIPPAYSKFLAEQIQQAQLHQREVA